MRKALPAEYCSLRPRLGGLASILAQAPAVSAAFGKWPGFILMMTAMVIFLAVCVVTISASSKVVTYLLPLKRSEPGNCSATIPFDFALKRQHFEYCSLLVGSIS